MQVIYISLCKILDVGIVASAHIIVNVHPSVLVSQLLLPAHLDSLATTVNCGKTPHYSTLAVTNDSVTEQTQYGAFHTL